MTPADRITDAARRLFGYTSLRTGQREAIQSVLDGHDTLAVLATGAGKSAIYELAGPLLGGSTVVISPLIALQRDQLASLEDRGHLRATALNSVTGMRERHRMLDELATDAHRPDFLFLAPEQLANTEVLARVKELQPVLFAVDEAHLVSQWGPDFRPDYLRIGPAIEALGHPPVLALTATAAPPVREEILNRLGLRDPMVLVRGFGRPNIHLAVHSYFTDEDHKLEVLTGDVIDAVHTAGAGIVYGATRHRVESLAAEIVKRGIRAAPYHAGLNDKERRQLERRFHSDDLEVVVTTVAFGMGIDKPNIRWVFHADVSPSIDEYYQELGRAGRDGEPARAVLYFRTEDLALPRRYAASAGPSRDALTAVVTALASNSAPTTVQLLSSWAGISKNRTEVAAMALADAQVIAVGAEGDVAVTGDLAGAVERTAEMVTSRRAVERTRVEMIQAYAEQFDCRWKFLLEYFGEPSPGRCGRCDNDESARAMGDDAQGDKPFLRGSRVFHKQFGEGEVIGYVGTRMVVDFDRVGYKRLDVKVVVENDLLEPDG